jgi:predicted membrane metal-binding protein
MSNNHEPARCPKCQRAATLLNQGADRLYAAEVARDNAIDRAKSARLAVLKELREWAQKQRKLAPPSSWGSLLPALRMLEAKLDEMEGE